jgi:DNA-3-methyladenine glycosylase I
VHAAGFRQNFIMSAKTGLHTDDSNNTRCFWCMSDPLYVAYHDREWGRPVFDDVRLFEKICLEGFQSGLSWLIVLRKRENFREVFDDFNMEKVARYTKHDVNRLLKNAGIIRHRGKIESTINNARRAIELIEECGSLAAYSWRYESSPKSRTTRLTWQMLIKKPTTPESIAMSKDLKKRGWSFVGPTTIYAFMQAVGLVNDHITGCMVREKVNAAYGRSKRRLAALR